MLCSPCIQQSPLLIVLQHPGLPELFWLWPWTTWLSEGSVLQQRAPAWETTTPALSIRAGVWQTPECAYKAGFVPARLPARHFILVFFVLGHVHCREDKLLKISLISAYSSSSQPACGWSCHRSSGKLRNGSRVLQPGKYFSCSQPSSERSQFRIKAPVSSASKGCLVLCLCCGAS